MSELKKAPTAPIAPDYKKFAKGRTQASTVGHTQHIHTPVRIARKFTEKKATKKMQR